MHAYIHSLSTVGLRRTGQMWSSPHGTYSLSQTGSRIYPEPTPFCLAFSLPSSLLGECPGDKTSMWSCEYGAVGLCHPRTRHTNSWGPEWSNSHSIHSIPTGRKQPSGHVGVHWAAVRKQSCAIPGALEHPGSQQTLRQHEQPWLLTFAKTLLWAKEGIFEGNSPIVFPHMEVWKCS